MPSKIDSFQEPCSKCLKKHGDDLTNWTPCKSCPWTTNPPPPPKILRSKKKLSIEKSCMECEENINFLEPEKDKYLCGKVKCLRSYIQRKSEKEK